MIVCSVFGSKCEGICRIYLPETKGRDACEISHLVEHGFKSKPLDPKAFNVDTAGHEMSSLTEKTDL